MYHGAFERTLQDEGINRRYHSADEDKKRSDGEEIQREHIVTDRVIERGGNLIPLTVKMFMRGGSKCQHLVEFFVAENR